jgi:hypothetical protein
MVFKINDDDIVQIIGMVLSENPLLSTKDVQEFCFKAVRQNATDFTALAQVFPHT